MHELIKGGSLMCTGGSQKRIDGPHSVKYSPRIFEGYGRQKGWEREAPATGADNGREKTPDGFVEVTEQMELPF